jgi:hypothetical protein
MKGGRRESEGRISPAALGVAFMAHWRMLRGDPSQLEPLLDPTTFPKI